MDIVSPKKVRNKILKPQHPHLGGWRKRFARTADLGAEADLGLGVGAVAADRGAVQLIAGRHGGHVLGVGPQRGEHGAGRGHLLGVGHQRRVRGLPQPHLRTQSDVTTVAVFPRPTNLPGRKTRGHSPPRACPRLSWPRCW